jgi:phosphatidate cytidylyltransferase
MRSGNFIAASAAMAQPVSEAARRQIALRVLSALVLAPVAVAAAYAGGPAFYVLIGFFAAVMAWEWAKLFGAERVSLAVPVAVAAVAAMLAAAFVFGTVSGLGVMIACMAPAYVILRVSGAGRPAWFAAGLFYIGVPALSLLWLRAEPAFGREGILWLFAVVWASDIGAYFSGTLIGGPRLAPAISPQKTWAGGIGGLAAAGLVSLAAVPLVGPVDAAGLIGLGLVLGLAAQLGDLLESAIKRRFGVKDISHTIPGHGGVFDRVDGLLTAAPVAAVAVWGGLGPW